MQTTVGSGEEDTVPATEKLARYLDVHIKTNQRTNKSPNKSGPSGHEARERHGCVGAGPIGVGAGKPHGKMRF